MLDSVKIIFGMELDGESWSRGTSVNKYVCGPLGLLKYIETKVGRTGREVSEAERIGAYREKICAARTMGADLWCARSFEADAWSTAKQMLDWRDQIKELKRDLNLSSDVSRRFDDIVAIEAAGNALSEGIIDRVVALLKTGRHIGREVNLVCLPEDLPQLWHDLIAAYFNGMTVCRSVRSNPKIEIVRAHDEVVLAREFARWIAAGKGENEDVALIVDGDSSLLDAELKTLGQPAIGHAGLSVSRQTLQILPGKIAELWRGRRGDATVDAETLRTAIEAANGELQGRIARDELAKTARSHVAAIRKLTIEGTAFKRPQLMRMLETVVGEGCCRPGAWNEVGCPRSVKSPEALFASGDADYPKPKYTLWWDFSDRPVLPRIRLTELEIDVVGAAVVRHDAEALRRRELSGWRLAMENTEEWVVFFVPYMKDGESVALHPFYDYLAKELGKDTEGEAQIKKMTTEAADLIDENGVWRLAGRVIDTLVEVQSPRREFEDICRFPRVERVPDSVSQSQMESLISCPFAWYHRYYLGLKPDKASAVESEAIRRGRHAHKVVEELVRQGAKGVADVQRRFDAVFDASLADELPELLDPESVVRKDAYRVLLFRSVTSLWQKITDDRLTIVGCEVEREQAGFHGSRLHGFIDMLLKDRDGRNVVFDFKWSRGLKRFEETIDKGTSIQFAVYHHLLGEGTKCFYYLFPLKKFVEDVQDDAAVFGNVEDSYVLRLKEVMSGTVKKAIVTGLDVTSSASEKKARAAEVTAAGLTIDLPARCDFCEFHELCGRVRKSKENWR